MLLVSAFALLAIASCFMTKRWVKASRKSGSGISATTGDMPELVVGRMRDLREKTELRINISRNLNSICQNLECMPVLVVAGALKLAWQI